MSELKPCPHCEDEAALETMQVRKGWEADVHCNGCPACIHTITYDTEAEAIAAAETAWNRRAQPANEPLTICSEVEDSYLVENYGKTWVAYEHKPEVQIGVDLASGHDFTAYGCPPERSENDGL